MFGKKGYAAILRELYSMKRLGIRPAIGPAGKFLHVLGDPQDKYPTFHVAGTNGKGSTVAMLASTLKEAGYRTGAYYSPHIADIRERFPLDGRFLPKAQIVSTLRRMGKAFEKAGMEPLTFFEWGTALAFSLFADAGADAAVIETGMGGNFDATNMIVPEVSVITNISLEHTAILGKTKEAIAAEKAGIIKRGVPVVCGDMPGSVRAVIRKAALKKGSRAFFLGMDFSISGTGLFSPVGGPSFKIEPGMSGRYQLKNAAVAAQAALLAAKFRLRPDVIAKGIKKAWLPGRFEEVNTPGGEVIFDVAHNPAAVRELVKLLRPRGRFDIVFGALADKNVGAMLKALAPAARRMYCITPADDRALSGEELARKARGLGIKATSAKAESVPLGGRVVVTGSFTTVESMKPLVRKL